MSIENPELFLRLAVAFAVGLLIGLERGWERRGLEEGRRVAGLRTFGLVGGLGGIAAVLAENSGGIVLAAIAIVVGGIAVVGHWRDAGRSEDVGITTTVALVGAFGLGALAGGGHPALAAAGAVVTTLLLGFKPELHRLLERIDRRELLATMRMLVISVVLLPVLPNQGFGPWQALNPFRIWWMVVLVAAISYVGYFAVRIAGPRRGFLLTGLLGGLASSTAVSVSFARIARDRPAAGATLAAGIVAASSVMFPRLLLIAAVLSPAVGARLAAVMIPAAIAGLVAGGWLAWRAGRPGAGEATAEPRNPLDLRFALEFGALLAAVLLAVHAMRAWAGEAGLFAVAALSGLADVDAITLSLASLAAGDAAMVATASTGILLAAAINTGAKIALAAGIGGGAVGWRVGAALGATLIAAGIGWWIGGVLPGLGSG